MSAIAQHNFNLIVKEFIFFGFEKVGTDDVFPDRAVLADMFVDDLDCLCFINIPVKIGAGFIDDFNKRFAIAHADATCFFKFKAKVFGFFQCFYFFVGFTRTGCNAATAQPNDDLCCTHSISGIILVIIH